MRHFVGTSTPSATIPEWKAEPKTHSNDIHSDQTSSRRMKIALVTSFPPSRGDLNEYGYHLACALRDDPGVELVILADETSSVEEAPGFNVQRCWRFNSAFNVLRLLRAVRKTNPDVVWFNIGFSTFARDPLAAFLGITVPALVRRLGYYSHVTLHTVFERINLEDAGVRWPGLYRAAGRVATRLLLSADDVSVLLPSFRSELINKYGVDERRVHSRPHGIFQSAKPAASAHSSQPTVLAFGYWGTYKRLELLLESMEEIGNKVPEAVLAIAGMNHPSTPGYLESLQERYRGNRRIRFLGYVPEEELPALFRSASVLVLPYTSAAGTSGVVHQACEYGLPMVAADIPEMRELAREEGIAIDFYAQGDGDALTNHLVALLGSIEMRRRASEHNSSVAQGMQMSSVVNEYLHLFEVRLKKPGELEKCPQSAFPR